MIDGDGDGVDMSYGNVTVGDIEVGGFHREDWLFRVSPDNCPLQFDILALDVDKLQSYLENHFAALDVVLAKPEMETGPVAEVEDKEIEQEDFSCNE